MEQKVINNRLDWMDWAKSIGCLRPHPHAVFQVGLWLSHALLFYAFRLFAEEAYRA